MNSCTPVFKRIKIAPFWLAMRLSVVYDFDKPLAHNFNQHFAFVFRRVLRCAYICQPLLKIKRDEIHSYQHSLTKTTADT